MKKLTELTEDDLRKVLQEELTGFFRNGGPLEKPLGFKELAKSLNKSETWLWNLMNKEGVQLPIHQNGKTKHYFLSEVLEVLKKTGHA